MNRQNQFVRQELNQTIAQEDGQSPQLTHRQQDTFLELDKNGLQVDRVYQKMLIRKDRPCNRINAWVTFQRFTRQPGQLAVKRDGQILFDLPERLPDDVIVIQHPLRGIGEGFFLLGRFAEIAMSFCQPGFKENQVMSSQVAFWQDGF